MVDELNVQLRETRGKRHARRLRNAGWVPAVLYGHGEEPVSLSVSTEELDGAVRHGTRLVNLIGAVRQQAFVRELQWDTWGIHVLHVDFTRISAHERVQVQVTVELRGEAPGIKEGGVVEQLLHVVQIECEVTAIPEKVEVNVNHLNLGDSIGVQQLEISEGAKILGDAEAVVVHCVQPMVAPEEVEAEAEEAEPEVIGRKAEEEGEGAH